MALSKTPPERTELRNLRGCIPDHVGGVGWRVCTGLLDEFLVQHPRIEHISRVPTLPAFITPRAKRSDRRSQSATSGALAVTPFGTCRVPSTASNYSLRPIPWQAA